jgi:hypothetical protein
MISGILCGQQQANRWPLSRLNRSSPERMLFLRSPDVSLDFGDNDFLFVNGQHPCNRPLLAGAQPSIFQAAKYLTRV